MQPAQCTPQKRHVQTTEAEVPPSRRREAVAASDLTASDQIERRVFVLGMLRERLCAALARVDAGAAGLAAAVEPHLAAAAPVVATAGSVNGGGSGGRGGSSDGDGDGSGDGGGQGEGAGAPQAHAHDDRHVPHVLLHSTHAEAVDKACLCSPPHAEDDRHDVKLCPCM